ncbi:MAG: galactokinase [Bryobacterales bacterium]|nr:galactokinase [Bryobacterales bacterium]MBV9397037.1 galactokinase [Bryobacterales bacterium]
MNAAAGLASRFAELFGGAPRIFRAPGRVNLIGEHTDYNDGFVMPAAIQVATHVAIAPAQSRRLTLRSENLGETVAFELDEPGPRPRGDWSDYVRGVAITIGRSGRPISGANLLIHGNIPLGAGLSSSASLEVAVAVALLADSGVTMDPTQVALLCQRAEDEFVGARCGIMDQFTACNARANHALMLDCRSLDAAHFEIPRDLRLAVCNTMVKHELASGEYNRRRQQCEEGVRVLSEFIPGIRALRDITMEQLQEFGSTLHPTILRRCRHVVSENARVQAAAQALSRGDLEEFGELMRCSHLSLRDDYEVSCPELDVMVELALGLEGVYGSRMTGGGFGGCTISLVKAEWVDSFSRAMAQGYEKQTGMRPEIYICSAADGASEELF